MQRLTNTSLAEQHARANLSAGVERFSYNRAQVRPGVVHFGVGNFHRSHQAFYIEQLLERGSSDWGIVGVSLRSSSARDRLAPQDYLYTLATLGEESRLRIVGALLDILVARENPEAVIAQVADPAIKLVTTTITEKGYCLTGARLDEAHTDFSADLVSLENPRSIYGYLASAILRRAQTDAATKITAQPSP